MTYTASPRLKLVSWLGTRFIAVGLGNEDRTYAVTLPIVDGAGCFPITHPTDRCVSPVKRYSKAKTL
ncbi:MAG TPA: hypothetical protein DEA78_08605 [Cyanobacteria bacterium UBA11159]|nr:hypothetical protein [Cyanobacteria bacterium UBA11159]